ncbi:MAG TPA: ABC transporter substrate-binding protein, partial [Nocardioidaceae bacterium]|nr:ABC transporter substrate-binding protein [Nocardioidaceae bacterium]
RGQERRHERMIHDREWDAAEVSLSSYLVAKDRGSDLTAIPVVPRRLFSQGLLFVRADSEVRQPTDLEGQRVGISSYQTTLSVLAKGDLAHEHGVDWTSITWVTDHAEALDVDLPPEVTVETAPNGRRIADLLLAGDVAAVVMPHPPRSLIGSTDGVRRLFPDAKQTELDYYRRHGYWPVMHLVAIRPETVQEHPWFPRALYKAFEQAKAELDERYLDPNWSMLAWGRSYLDAERAELGGDPWRNGVRANETNLRRFMSYSREQGLTTKELGMEQLFHPSLLQT